MGPDLLDRTELAQACSVLDDAVEQGEPRHLGDQALLDAINGAGTSSQGGDYRVFSRRSSRVDISPLYAAVPRCVGRTKELDDAIPR